MQTGKRRTGQKVKDLAFQPSMEKLTSSCAYRWYAVAFSPATDLAPGVQSEPTALLLAEHTVHASLKLFNISPALATSTL